MQPAGSIPAKLSVLDNLEQLGGKGVYTLVVLVPAQRTITVGSLGSHRFPAGYYAYTGSALGRGAVSLRGRVLRHLREDKKRKWHIDHLLSGANAEMKAVIAANTEKKLECEINCYLKDRLRAEIPVPKFGSSDCRKNCGSHLLYLGQDQHVPERTAQLYSEKLDAKIFFFSIGHLGSA